MGRTKKSKIRKHPVGEKSDRVNTQYEIFISIVIFGSIFSAGQVKILIEKPDKDRKFPTVIPCNVYGDWFDGFELGENV